MPRSGAGIHFDIRWIVGRESAFGGVEMVEKDFVEAEISDESEAIVGSSSNPVGMGTFLALFVDAGPGVLDEGGGGSEATVFADGEYRDTAAVIVGDESVLAGFVE